MSIGFLLNNGDNAVLWRGRMKNAMIKQFLTDVCWGDLDFLLIYTPPGTSDEPMIDYSWLKICDITIQMEQFLSLPLRVWQCLTSEEN